MKAFGSESENCRRKKLLEAVGSSEMIYPGNLSVMDASEMACH